MSLDGDGDRRQVEDRIDRHRFRLGLDRAAPVGAPENHAVAPADHHDRAGDLPGLERVVHRRVDRVLVVRLDADDRDERLRGRLFGRVRPIGTRRPRLLLEGDRGRRRGLPSAGGQEQKGGDPDDSHDPTIARPRG